MTDIKLKSKDLPHEEEQNIENTEDIKEVNGCSDNNVADTNLKALEKSPESNIETGTFNVNRDDNCCSSEPTLPSSKQSNSKSEEVPDNLNIDIKDKEQEITNGENEDKESPQASEIGDVKNDTKAAMDTDRQRQSEHEETKEIPDVKLENDKVNEHGKETQDDECKGSKVTNKEVDKVDVKTEQGKNGDGSGICEKELSPEKELPEWFKMMTALTHGIKDGMEMKETEDVTETIDIHGSTQAITVRTNERLFQLIMKRLHRITRRRGLFCSCAPDISKFHKSKKDAQEKKLNHLVEDLLEPLVEIDDVNVTCEDENALCHRGGVPVLHIRCSSCQSLYRVVTALNSPIFKDGIIQIKDCLEQEMKDKLKIDANITQDSIKDIEHHLRDQGIIKSTDDFVSCGLHPGNITEVFCFEHNNICCSSCVETEHSSCKEVELVSGETEKRSVIIGKVKEYNVRLHTETNDDGNCDIIACCALPEGEVILADMNNKRLKRLNKDLKIIDHCDLPDCPRDVCFIGNDMLAVTLFDPGIQFVDISGKMKLKEKVHIEHDCFGIAFYGGTLYITDPMKVYMYDSNGVEKGVFYKQIVGNHSFCKIAVSKNGERFYIAGRDGGLVTIDKDGKRLSHIHKGDLAYVSDVCVVGDGTVLTCNCRRQTVSRIDPDGKLSFGRVAQKTNDMYMPQSLCYDRVDSRLIVGHLHDDYISVMNFK